ncbi:hypothetical protein E2C01_057564 [Portunus trituberculatus]|uniref:Uncharacterized protein n=1 Tax=Portunus trituberculatus TaxID=210409 RepID=A0A5B7H1F3_PORTR|nr:hypothetical protein [Portunus trituberculatus]
MLMVVMVVTSGEGKEGGREGSTGREGRGGRALRTCVRVGGLKAVSITQHVGGTGGVLSPPSSLASLHQGVLYLGVDDVAARVIGGNNADWK